MMDDAIILWLLLRIEELSSLLPDNASGYCLSCQGAAEELTGFYYDVNRSHDL